MMTAAMIPGVLQAASAVLDSISEPATSGTSGERFSSVMRTAMQRSDSGRPAVDGKATQGADQAAGKTDVPSGEGIPDAQTLSLIQQALAQIALLPGITNDQFQKIASQFLAGVSATLSSAGNMAQGLTAEQIAGNLKSALKENGFGGFLENVGETDAKSQGTPRSLEDILSAVPADEKPNDSAGKPTMASSAGTRQDAEPLQRFDMKAASESSTKGFQQDRSELRIEVLETPVDQMTAGPALVGNQYAVQKNDVPVSAVSDTAPTASAAIADIPDTIRSAAENGTRHLVVRLDPPDLGQVHIRLRMSQGVLTAELKVDSGSTKDVFTTALPQIRASLENAGIKVGELHIDLREEYASDQDARRHQHGQNNHRQQNNSAARERFFEYLA